MADVALLNPQKENEVARSFIDLAADRLGKLQVELGSTVMDRERYLLKIGAATEIDRLISDMQQLYDRKFKV